MKKLKLKIWVEDENDKVVSSTQMSGGLAHLNPKNINTLEFDGNSEAELELKVLTNVISTMVRAKFKDADKYIENLKIEREKLKKIRNLYE